jgi:SAM-dependent methyltransferase
VALQELTWFHPTLMDAGIRRTVEPVHALLGLPRGTSLRTHAVGPDGLRIEGSKHWEYAYALNRAGLPDRAGRRVLDAGCGSSAFTAYLARHGNRVHGIDVNPTAVARLRPHCAGLSVGDLQALPYRDETFDRVFCISVLEHTRDPLRCFDELWRVTRRGGTLTVTGDYAPWGLPSRTPTAGQVMDRTRLRDLVGTDRHLPEETPTVLEGLGYFPQMWPTVLPVYLRFVKDVAAPPRHGSGSPPDRRDLSLADPRLRRHLARQCRGAARIYLAHDWLPEARDLFARAWRLDRRQVAAAAWAAAARLPRPVLRAARRVRHAVARRARIPA